MGATAEREQVTARDGLSPPVCAGRTLLKSDISVAPTSAAHKLFA